MQQLIPSKKNQSVLIAEIISLKPQKIASKVAYEAPSAMLSRSCFILKAPKKYHELNPPEFFFFFFMLNKPKRQGTFALHMSYVYQKFHVFIILNMTEQMKIL